MSTFVPYTGKFGTGCESATLCYGAGAGLDG